MANLERLVKEAGKTDSTRSRSPNTSVWCMPESGITVTGVVSVGNLRKIEQPAGAPDILVRAKRSWLGRFYQKNLKRIPFFRMLAIWLWRNLPSFTAPLDLRPCSRVAKRWRPLVKLADYVKASQIATINVLDAARVDTPIPRVFPIEDQAHLLPPHDQYVFPPVYVAELGEALVYGGTNFVFTHNAVICHDLYDFARDYTSEELNGRHVIDGKKMRMRLLCHDAVPEKIGMAATFVDACAPNYAHWLTEVLPRIAAFCSLEQFANIPIVINDGLHRNIMESLALIVGPEREVIPLPVGRAVQVDRLYVTSVAGYVPFERRDAKLKNHSHGLFSPPAFQLVRDRCSSFVDGMSPQEWPRRIYIRRTAGARRVTNGADIEKVLLKNGYIAVEPETLTFVQQVALFSNAKDIIGSSGAALANLMFAPPTTGVHIFIGKIRGTSYWYWQNIACSSKKTVIYIFGRVAGAGAGIHSDFRVDVEDVIQALEVRS